MPKRLLLEGPDIEELLSQVRNEHGPDVSIVSADRVRTGGFAGFFARQRYELTVEIADPPARPATPEPAPAAAPIDPVAALLEQAEQQERRLGATGAPQSIAAASRAAAQSIPAQGQARAEALLTQAKAAAAKNAAAKAAVKAPEDFVVETGTENLAFADMLAALQRDSAVPARTGTMVARAYQPSAVAEEQAAVSLVEQQTAALALVEEQAAALAPRAYRPPVAEPRTARVEALMELGMPEHLARRVTGSDTYAAIKRVMAELPQAAPAPGRPGDVLVIVGETQAALTLAKEVARVLNVGSGQILLAARSTAGTEIHTARRLSGPVAALRKARKIHRDDVPYIVVVASAPDEGNGEWACSVADALGATAVWAIVDATRKTADTARHLRTLGKIDAIAVNSLNATGDPASVLDLNIPVSYLADRPCTPQEWAGLLCERLEEAQS
ncbi:hypothetical protein [Planobispora takensis]|uniref:Flagellar biosynthesis protein FlhF n=1 Tax=Planobispora takensis TaxID=1367882 RepID=A0A8J3WX98_9ACTN|nr:hypothetical protein [Planobispora takensis]GII05681.1 hypothetical protein Pta02_76890 [Planobispora takensis]